MIMSAEARAAGTSTGGADFDHLYCCDPNRSWCGADISGDVDHPEDCDCPECPLCWLAEPSLTCRCADEGFPDA